jgi:hypothetical protein
MNRIRLARQPITGPENRPPVRLNLLKYRGFVPEKPI